MATGRNPGQYKGVVAWFDANTVSEGDGQEVTLWENQVDHEYGDLDGTATNVPVVVASAIDDRKALYFDGVNGCHLQNTGTTWDTGINNSELWMVVRHTVTPGAGANNWFGPTNSPFFGDWMGPRFRNTSGDYIQHSSQVGGSWHYSTTQYTQDTNWHLVRFRNWVKTPGGTNQAFHYFYEDGPLVYSEADSTERFGGVGTLRGYWGVGMYAAGDKSEVEIAEWFWAHDTVFTCADDWSLRVYYQDKYPSLTITMP
jgi:hypothetical protein